MADGDIAAIFERIDELYAVSLLVYFGIARLVLF